MVWLVSTCAAAHQAPHVAQPSALKAPNCARPPRGSNEIAARCVFRRLVPRGRWCGTYRGCAQLPGPRLRSLSSELGVLVVYRHEARRDDRLEDGTTKTMRFCIRLVLEWQEIGGPPVIALGNPSYGTSTIRDLIPYEFGGTVDFVFAPEGVRCRIQLPADWLSEAGSGAITRAAAK